MFATSSRARVRRNRLSDFTRVMANGKIAMKLEEDGEGAQLVSVHDLRPSTMTCLLASRQAASAFASRSPTFACLHQPQLPVGVRGIRAGQGR